MFREAVPRPFTAGLACLFALAVLLGAFGASYRNTEQLVATAQWRDHTLEVIAEIRRLYIVLDDLQTSERGYLLSGNAAFLAPLRQGRQEVSAHLARLRRLTADNPRQQRRLAELAPEMQAELAALEGSEQSAQRAGLGAGWQGEAAPTAASAEAAADRHRMETLRRHFGALEEEESGLLGLRSRAMVESVRRTNLSLLAAALAGTALLGVAFAGLNREIARRREKEAEMLRLNQRLKLANDELEAFCYSVSHDLRAPLRAVDGFSLAVLEDAGERLEPPDREMLERVRTASRRMATLIDDLLRLSRISRAPLQPRAVDLSAIAADITGELLRSEPARHPRRPRLPEVEIEPSLQAVGDENLLRIALENLLGNSWKFTRDQPRPRIAFGSEHQDGGAGATVYTVRDNGAGFDMAYADKLFGPFQRLHLEREFEGTGIGLATVARIVHIHGGRIWAEAEVGKGATFHFTLGGGASSSASRGERQ